jgi:dTDP-4-dehydrorhamnose reductase
MNVLIFGASGWVGRYIAEAFNKLDVEVVGSYFNQAPALAGSHAFQFDTRDVSALGASIDTYRPAIILNALYSERYDELLNIHKHLTDLTRSQDIHYVYLSSAVAVEKSNRFHDENELANAMSAYGKLKEESEAYLFSQQDNGVAIRFSATHGFSASSMRRTNAFYRSLKKGEIVSIDTGVLQNRTFIGDLADMIAAVSLRDAIQGICHLGATDYSDEFVFRQKLAAAFGFDPEQVVPGVQKDVNVVTVPGKLYEHFGNTFKIGEDEAISRIAAQKDLFETIAHE